jgi:hypothetical protein
VDHVGLGRVKERLHVCGLAGGTAARHALLHPVGGQAGTKRHTQILAAAIAAKDQARRRPAPVERCIDHSPGEL